jgi:hypothetical protein
MKEEDGNPSPDADVLQGTNAVWSWLFRIGPTPYDDGPICDFADVQYAAYRVLGGFVGSKDKRVHGREFVIWTALGDYFQIAVHIDAAQSIIERISRGLRPVVGFVTEGSSDTVQNIFIPIWRYQAGRVVMYDARKAGETAPWPFGIGEIEFRNCTVEWTDEQLAIREFYRQQLGR